MSIHLLQRRNIKFRYELTGFITVNESKKPKGIPGFPTESIIFSLVLVSILSWIYERRNR